MKPILSLVIATLDRVPELERCLASLEVNNELRSLFEVVVVDQSSDRAAYEVVRRFEERLQISFTYQSVPAVSPARNLGVSFARGEWVGFPDDDARFRGDTLPLLLQAITSGAWDLITGMTCNEEGTPTVLRWRSKAYPITRHTIRTTVAESTLFMRRDLFLRHQGFDPTFGPGGLFGAEEAVDLIRRIQREAEAARMQYLPQIKILHADAAPYRDRAALRKVHLYARARGACFARHWRQASKRRIENDVARHLIGSMIFRGLRRECRIRSLQGYVRGFCDYHREQRAPAIEHGSVFNTAVHGTTCKP